MADIVDRETRSRMMSRIRGRDTGPELALRRAIWARGGRGFRTHPHSVFGKPDLAWVGQKVAVFVDGAFWHGHPSAYKRGKSGQFWDKKIERNIQRDRQVTRFLRRAGWVVVRIWDFDVCRNPSACARRVLKHISRRRGRRAHGRLDLGRE